MSKYAVVDLKGGLANQIFQISFANSLKLLNFNTYLDISFYDTVHRFPRNLEVDPSILGFKKIKLKSNIFFKFNKSIYIEDETFEIKNLKKYNRFVGYYQNLIYLEKSKKLLQTKLNLKSNHFKNDNLVALHIRSTDYSTIEQQLKSSYYKSSINKLLQINKDLRFDIFSDDKNLKIDTKVFKNINKIYLPKSNETPLEVMISMLNYKYYIIANSSFSTIPAFLSEYQNKVVLYPQPWWRNSYVKMQNIPSDWIDITNE
ncbi:hypothetical protein N9T02_01115 [Candidatus Actinomarina]|nr:hypothetical protein [Candidatus Actinomarina sp.]|tara:strand:- start:889 stop:1665 length:777 start_codon:yes stop_codon:yes gene_type:complete